MVIKQSREMGHKKAQKAQNITDNSAFIRLCANSRHWTSSLCNLCVLCASVVKKLLEKTTIESQSTQRLQRETRLFVAKIVHPFIAHKNFRHTGTGISSMLPAGVSCPVRGSIEKVTTLSLR